MASIAQRTKTDRVQQAPVAVRQTAGASKPVIFVVEDDWNIRRFVCNLLRYATTASVVEADDPYSALFMARKMDRPIDLLISDIDLSAGINGVDLAHKLAITNPFMKVLLMSGADAPQGEIPAAWRFLAKPFPVKRFLESVNALRGSASEPAAYFG